MLWPGFLFIILEMGNHRCPMKNFLLLIGSKMFFYSFVDTNSKGY